MLRPPYFWFPIIQLFTLSLSGQCPGYSENAIRHKVKNGTWMEGRIWRKAPDGRIFVNVVEFERWVESETHTIAF